jgi:hypothetical protein
VRRTKRPVVVVEHLSSAELAYERFSTFGVAAAGAAQRPSAWAAASAKRTLFDVSPVKKRHAALIADAQQQTSLGGDPAGDAIVVGVDESLGKVVKVIRDRPQTADAVAAQKELSSRLSTPRAIYVRKEDLARLQQHHSGER